MWAFSESGTLDASDVSDIIGKLFCNENVRDWKACYADEELKEAIIKMTMKLCDGFCRADRCFQRPLFRSAYCL